MNIIRSESNISLELGIVRVSAHFRVRHGAEAKSGRADSSEQSLFRVTHNNCLASRALSVHISLRGK